MNLRKSLSMLLALLLILSLVPASVFADGDWEPIMEEAAEDELSAMTTIEDNLYYKGIRDYGLERLYDSPRWLNVTVGHPVKMSFYWYDYDTREHYRIPASDLTISDPSLLSIEEDPESEFLILTPLKRGDGYMEWSGNGATIHFIVRLPNKGFYTAPYASEETLCVDNTLVISDSSITDESRTLYMINSVYNDETPYNLLDVKVNETMSGKEAVHVEQVLAAAEPTYKITVDQDIFKRYLNSNQLPIPGVELKYTYHYKDGDFETDQTERDGFYLKDDVTGIKLLACEYDPETNTYVPEEDLEYYSCMVLDPVSNRGRAVQFYFYDGTAYTPLDYSLLTMGGRTDCVTITEQKGAYVMKPVDSGLCTLSYKGYDFNIYCKLPSLGFFTEPKASYESYAGRNVTDISKPFYMISTREGYDIIETSVNSGDPAYIKEMTRISPILYKVVFDPSMPVNTYMSIKGSFLKDDVSSSSSANIYYRGTPGSNPGTPAEPTLVAVSLVMNKTAFKVGDALNAADWTAKAVYSNGDSFGVSSSAKINGFDTSKPGTVLVTASFAGLTSNAVAVTVSAASGTDENVPGTDEGGESTTDSIAIAYAPNLAYTGKAVVQPAEVLKLTCGERTLLPKTDYAVSYKNNKIVGEATMTITLKGSYKTMGDHGGATITKTFNVVPADLSEAVMSTIKAQTYSGAELKPKATFKLGKTSLKAGKDYEIVYSNNVEIGEAAVTITGMGNYTGTACGTFRINGAPISKAKVTLVPKTVMYTGEAQNPLTLTYGKEKKVLTEGEDYAVHFVNDNSKVGKVLYWIEGLGNFDGTTMGTEAKPKNFKINAYDLKKGLAAGEVVICTASGIPSVTVNGTVLKQDVDYTCKITVGKNNLFTFAIKGMGNYKGSVTIKETITEPVG